MTDSIGAVVSANGDHDPGLVETCDSHGLAIGGTLYGAALSMAAARTGLAEISSERRRGPKKKGPEP